MTASTPASADPPPTLRYRIIDLGALECWIDPETSCEGQSYAYGINNRGEVVGVSEVCQSPTCLRGFIWLPVANYGLQGRLITRLPEPSGLSSTLNAFDINIDGIIVGSIGSGTKEFQGDVNWFAPPSLADPPNPAFIWNPPFNVFNATNHHAINPIHNASAEAYAISDDAPPVIAGVTDYLYQHPSPPVVARGFQMEYTGQTQITSAMLLSPTGFPAWWNSFAFGAGLGGTVTGHSVPTPQCSLGGWCDGTTDCNRGNHWYPTGILEAVIDENDVYSYTVGRDVNSAGNVIGSSFHDFGLGGQCVEHGAFWLSVNDPPVPLPPDNVETRAWAIAAPFGNELQAVGADMDQNRAMLWRSLDGGQTWLVSNAIDLNGQYALPQGDVIHCGDKEWTWLIRAYDINDHGWIVGYGRTSESTANRAFLMIPEPEGGFCPADLNGDFRVDVQDLLILLGAWGPYSGTSCFGSPDINGSGVVDVQDLLALLVSWGPCPGIDTSVLSLSDELGEAGLTWQNWQDYYNVMTGTNERAKARWTCWFNNYITQCNNCPVCPNPDPFTD